MPGKIVLVCPMDWGLGHASRDVEVIHNLLQSGFEVILGADGAPLLFLREHFPKLEYLVIPSYKISYPNKGSMVLKMLYSVPKIIWGIWKEHQLLKEIIKKKRIDLVISDNRFGLWNKKVRTVFISHQLWIKSPKSLRYAEPIINRINHWFINKYDECWVPDFENAPFLAGDLAHPVKKSSNVKYMGPLSRFKLPLSAAKEDLIAAEKFDILVILSGPEPQRSLLEQQIVAQLLKERFKTLIIRGKPGEFEQFEQENIRFINHLNSFRMRKFIIETPVIICRSGYSSVMDLITLQKSAILIPTPGQTEQEYLAECLKEKMWFYSVTQKDFELEKAMLTLEKFKINCKFENKSLLKECINSLNTETL